MKRVLVIGPHFAPSSLPPALRIRFFVRHLPEYGWEPLVLTADSRCYDWPVDPENELLLPGWLEVVRTPALPVRLTRMVGIRDIGFRTLWHHWRAASRLCRSGRVDLVFIPMPPHVPAVLGRLLHARHGIPYVVDYGDPWVSAAYRKHPRAERPRKRHLSYALSRLLEPVALRRAAHVTGVSSGTTDAVVGRYPWFGPHDATEIPLGGEPDDFEHLRKHPRTNAIFDVRDGARHLSYVGVCIPPMFPTVRAIFEAVRLGRERAPGRFSSLRLHFVGTNYPTPGTSVPERVMPLARECGVDDLVDECPHRLAYLEALQILLDSHALLAVGSDAPHYTASKIFPYILAQKPILAVFHEASSVVRVLADTRAGEVVTYDGERRPPAAAVSEIAEALDRLLRLPPDVRPPTRWEAFQPYTTRAMAGRLARAFDVAVARRPEAPA